MIVTEIDPINALQAAMEGYQVTTLDDVVGTADIFVTATGNTDIITVDDMAQDEAQRHRVQHRPLRQRDRHGRPGPQRGIEDGDQAAGRPVDASPTATRIIVLAEGRLVNLGCATGHPSFVMSCSFSNQVLAQVELFTKTADYPVGVYVLPKQPRREGGPRSTSTRSA